MVVVVNSGYMMFQEEYRRLLFYSTLLMGNSANTSLDDIGS